MPDAVQNACRLLPLRDALCAAAAAAGVGGVSWHFLAMQSLRVGWLLITGGPKVLKMTASTLSGAMGSVVQGGLDGGDIEYHVIVAKKP